MKNFKISLAVVLITFAAYYFTKSNSEGSLTESPTASNEALKVQKAPSAGQNDEEIKSNQTNEKENELTIKSLKEFDQIPEEHKRSLILSTQILYNFAERQTRSDSLIEKLSELEARPLVMNDDNPYTGSMKVVRTRSPFPGTRYFHAQYFDNNENEEFVQHMSFEFRPGKQSFEAVKKSIKQTFNLENPLENKKGFISWRHGSDYVIWIKEMDNSDMKDDPFNAYSKEDIGTIRVAKELEIHDQSPSFHMQQGNSEDQTP
jgi:hypothetical protein